MLLEILALSKCLRFQHINPGVKDARLIANGPQEAGKKVNYVTLEKKFTSINVVYNVKAAGAEIRIRLEHTSDCLDVSDSEIRNN